MKPWIVQNLGLQSRFNTWLGSKMLYPAFLSLCLIAALPINSQTISSSNRFNLGITAYSDNALPDAELAMLWQPDLAVKYPISAWLSLGLELSGQNRVSGIWDNANQDLDIYGEVYRYVLKLDTPQSELRAGLQRINFGSAQILRPLQWFDNLKPLDKLEQTRGVKALLARHYFNNNSNLWLWAMTADEDLKGNEMLLSKPDTFEWGGRYQFPDALGESAFSFHSRELDMGKEYRAGFDHRLDSFVGAWLEAAGSMQDLDSQSYMLSATLGMDYTLGIGNGLALTCENMSVLSATDRISKLSNNRQFTALMANYPLGLLDAVMLVGTWDWDESYGLVNLLWRRTYDLFSFDFSLSMDSGMPAQLSKSPALSFTISYNL
jgi:hypothetical protein